MFAFRDRWGIVQIIEYSNTLISRFRSQCTHSLCLRGGTLVDCRIQYSWTRLFCKTMISVSKLLLNTVFRKCDICHTYCPRHFCEYWDRITRLKRPREIGFTAKLIFFKLQNHAKQDLSIYTWFPNNQYLFIHLPFVIACFKIVVVIGFGVLFRRRKNK